MWRLESYCTLTWSPLEWEGSHIYINIIHSRLAGKNKESLGCGQIQAIEKLQRGVRGNWWCGYELFPLSQSYTPAHRSLLSVFSLSVTYGVHVSRRVDESLIHSFNFQDSNTDAETFNFCNFWNKIVLVSFPTQLWAESVLFLPEFLVTKCLKLLSTGCWYLLQAPRGGRVGSESRRKKETEQLSWAGTPIGCQPARQAAPPTLTDRDRNTPEIEQATRPGATRQTIILRIKWTINDPILHPSSPSFTYRFSIWK